MKKIVAAPLTENTEIKSFDSHLSPNPNTASFTDWHDITENVIQGLPKLENYIKALQLELAAAQDKNHTYETFIKWGKNKYDIKKSLLEETERALTACKAFIDYGSKKYYALKAKQQQTIEEIDKLKQETYKLQQENNLLKDQLRKKRNKEFLLIVSKAIPYIIFYHLSICTFFYLFYTSSFQSSVSEPEKSKGLYKYLSKFFKS